MKLDIVFDGPPGPSGGRFIEVERDGHSVRAGEWVERPDGYWVLRIDDSTESNGSLRHCNTCICGRRANMQRDETKGPGSVAWSEHLEIWSCYARRYGTSQSAERLAERGGFGYDEAKHLLGHAPTTWEPR